MPARKRFILALTAVLALVSLVVLPLTPTMAQGTPPAPERLSPGEHDGRSLEARAGELSKTAGKTETAQPTLLTWHIETVYSARDVGYFTSLALDLSAGSGQQASDQPRISYYDETYGDLKYAHFDGSSWISETVDSAGDVGWFTSLALDGAGRPHISYYDQTNGGLKYARFDGTSWQIETVDSAGQWGGYTSLALDAIGHPHISYYDPTNDDLKYAHFDGSSWISETIDSAGDVGWYTSLALDTSDRPHISYYEHTNGGLKYARFDGSSWISETVDGTGMVGFYTSLALDPNDHPHISYWDVTNGDLKYAHFDGSSWQIETVDSGLGSLGGYTSLALDAIGHPHISYYDATNDDLKYARFDGSSWQIETVDSAGWVGQFTSLALDTSDRPHISYYDYTNGDLKYTWGECVPVAGASIEGPAALPVEQTGLYTATYTPPTATLPVTITWDNGSVGPTAAYSWTVPGTYTLTLTATNPCGQVSTSFTVTIFCQPVEGVGVTGPAALPGGQTGLYSATTTPVTATLPVTITWDNGTVGPTAAYSWTAPGTYTLTVTATNPCGQVSTSFTVTVFCQLVEGVEVTGPADLLVGETGLYTATYTPLTATLPVTISWDNGSVGPTAAYSWTVPGTYTPTVTATNPCAEVSGTFSVAVQEPIAALEAVNDSPTVLGSPTTLSATVTAGSNVSYSWDLGDGALGNGAIVTHTYPNVGIYTALVTASNSVSLLTATTTVTITDVPIEGLSATNDSPTVLGDPTTLTATITAGSNVSLTWTFGDGTFSTGALLTHTYPAVGLYTALVTATDNVSMLTATTIVTVEEPIAGLSAFNDSPTPLGDPTTLTATLTAGSNVSFTWTFGDGTFGYSAVLTHTYPAALTYTAVVTASNEVSTMTATTVVTVTGRVYNIYLPLVLRGW